MGVVSTVVAEGSETTLLLCFTAHKTSSEPRLELPDSAAGCGLVLPLVNEVLRWIPDAANHPVMIVQGLSKQREGVV